jgi:hypothetical protein
MIFAARFFCSHGTQKGTEFFQVSCSGLKKGLHGTQEQKKKLQDLVWIFLENINI